MAPEKTQAQPAAALSGAPTIADIANPDRRLISSAREVHCNTVTFRGGFDE
jgi:hypothetical protein